jgi:secondary thiamine-phosphate synthase enzyme
MQTLTIQTDQRCQMIDVTRLVAAEVADRKIQTGMAIVYVPHTTAAVTINENADPDVQHDLLAKLQTLVPKSETYYEHGEGNSDSHVKTALVGSTVTVLIERGRLVLGQWQGIFFCEFDGPRRRSLIVQTVDFG